LALELLSIPIKATLPFPQNLNNGQDCKELRGDKFCENDPLDYIRNVQNIDKLRRDAIVNLNRSVW
jgi:hypothetical protein